MKAVSEHPSALMASVFEKVIEPRLSFFSRYSESRREDLFLPNTDAAIHKKYHNVSLFANKLICKERQYMSLF